MTRHAQALDVVGTLGFAQTFEEFAEIALRGLAELVPADLWGFNDLDPGSRQMHAAIWPPDGARPEDFEAVARVVWEHPVLNHFQQTGNGAALRLSDVWSRERYHASTLYREAYRAMNVEHQVSFSLADGAVAATVGFSANRHGQDFDDAECALLNALRAPLRTAWQMVHAQVALAASVRAARPSTESGLLLVGPRSRVRAASPGVLDLLAAAGLSLAEDETVPEPLLSWLQRSGHEREITVGTGDDAVVITFVAGGRDADRVLAVALAVTGQSRLTPREQQVVELAGDGASNAEIASILGLSERTVHKHLERAYAKLGVTNRSAAGAALPR